MLLQAAAGTKNHNKKPSANNFSALKIEELFTVRRILFTKITNLL